MRTDYCADAPGPCTHHQLLAREQAPVTEEFCGAYKGDHFFVNGNDVCRCGRAYRLGTATGRAR